MVDDLPRVKSAIEEQRGPEMAERTLQVAIDESFDDLGAGVGAYTLAGYVASPDDWDAFSRDWQAKCDEHLDGKPFKMNLMARRNRGRASKVVPQFYKVISNYVEFGFAITVDIAAHKEVFQNSEVPLWDNLYYFTFFNALYQLLRPGVFRDDPKLEFIFDDGWSAIINEQSLSQFIEIIDPAMSKRLVAAPHFRTDEEWLPLQAADLKAWFGRIRFKELFQGGKATPRYRGSPEDLPPTPAVHIPFNKAELINFRDNLWPHVPIAPVFSFGVAGAT